MGHHDEFSDLAARTERAATGLSGALANESELGEEHGTARDRIRGCLLAGAVGDALGGGIEFDSWSRIRATFGEAGLQSYTPAYGRVGAITDDTQMTLFTAEGLIRARNRMEAEGTCSPRHEVHQAYLRWLATQNGHRDPAHDGWLIAVPELWNTRAPGNTCLSALQSGQVGSMDEPINDSKGCGGVMRAAPAGFLAEAADRFRLGCDVAAITHGHADGYLPAGALAVVVGALVDGAELSTALDDAEECLRQARSHDATLAALRAGRTLGAAGLPAPEQLEGLGGGWVGEEALAIAVACAVGGIDRPAEAMLAAVNHSGDSDSTGSIAGNILGATHGVEWLPTPWLDELELRDVIDAVAVDCHRSFHGVGNPDARDLSDWWERYPGR
ncbi:ADP-ribosylglycohydrolase family protein [Agilicoccus flavus]|uniref:ADP-ribosylglycohydrolase family protein n=1 Tax=Agilicoccus flavus TaxID=2775968 RepID=UPI001CF639B2|nr:ADP-ribosylglycohydrolase family protein [Agilicoccus flavus]